MRKKIVAGNWKMNTLPPKVSNWPKASWQAAERFARA